MADNEVLGQDPIVPTQDINPELNGGVEPIDIRRDRFKRSNQSLEDAGVFSGAQHKQFVLPENITQHAFDKRLGEYHAVGGVDIPESVAQAQSGWEQALVDAPLRVMGKFTGELAKMAGMVVQAPFAIPEIIWGGKSFGEVMNSAWSASVDDQVRKFGEWAAPVYETNEYKEGNLFDKLGSTSFWATQGADGVGYLASMLVPGLVVGKILKPGASVARGISQLRKVAKPGADIEKFAASAKLAGTVDDYLAAGMNTFFEATAEGVERYKGSLNDNPEDIEGAADAARQTFLTNLAILAGPNLIQQKMIMGGFRRSALKSGLNEGLGETGIKGVAKQIQGSMTDGVLAKAIVKPGFMSQAGKVAKQLGYGAFREGLFEEGMQYAASEAAAGGIEGDWFGERAVNMTKETLKEWYKGFSGGAYEGEEFWTSAVLGGVLGGLMGGGAQIARNSREQKAASSLFNTMKNNQINYLKTADDFAQKDTDGKIITKDGKIVWDDAKMAQGGYQVIKNEELRRAAVAQDAMGFKDVADMNQNLIELDYMMPWLQLEGGKTLLKQHIPSLAKTAMMIEGATEANLSEEAIKKTEADLLSKVEPFAELVESITDTHSLNFRVKPVEGSTKDDIKNYSNIVLNSKFTEKANRDFSRDRLKKLRIQLLNNGITTTNPENNYDALNEMMKQYSDLDKAGTFDEAQKADITTIFKNFIALVEAESDSKENLVEMFDQEKLQKGFEEYIKAKKILKDGAATKTGDSGAVTAAKGKEIVDPALRKFWMDNIHAEDFADLEEGTTTVDESGKVTKVPMKSKLLVTRPILKITYTDEAGKEQSFFGALGEANKAGNVNVKKTVKSKGEWQVDPKDGNMAYLEDMNTVSIKTGPKEYTKFKATVDVHESAASIRTELQEKLFFTEMERMVNEYKSKFRAAQIDFNKTDKQIRAKNRELRTFLKEFKAEYELYVAATEGTSVVVGKRLLKKAYKVGETAQAISQEIIALEEHKTLMADLMVENKAQYNKFSERMETMKESGQIPSEWIRDALLANRSIIENSTALYQDLVEIIAYNKQYLNASKSLLKGYRTSLAKLLGVDISPKTLKITKLSPEEQIDKQMEVLFSEFARRAVTIPTDPADAIPDAVYLEAATLIGNAQKLQERRIAHEYALQKAEDMIGPIDEKLKKAEIEFGSLKFAYDEAFVLFKKSWPKFFSESKYYETKLVESGALYNIEKDFRDTMKHAGGTMESLHTFLNIESFLILTSNQKYVGTDEDVKRWFAFVTNYAYKGVKRSKKFKRDFAFKTFTFDQVIASKNKMLMSKVSFYDSLRKKQYTVDQYLKWVNDTKPTDADQTALKERLSNDIKAIVVDFSDTSKPEVFWENGMPDYAGDKGGSFPVYTSVGLGTEFYAESDYRRFGSETWRRSWVAAMLKEDPSLDKETLYEEDSVVAFDEFFAAEQLKFFEMRKDMASSQKVLYIDGINPGIKNEAESTLLDPSEAYDMDPKYFRIQVSNPKKDPNTGQHEKWAWPDDDGIVHLLTRGFAYVIKDGNAEPLIQKTLSDTGDVDNIFKLLQHVIAGKETSSNVRTYLEEALYMVYSKLTDNTDPYRMFFHRERDKKGIEKPGVYDYLVFGKDKITKEELAKGTGPQVAALKKFLATKYWNVDARALKATGDKGFMEYQPDGKGGVVSIHHKHEDGGYKKFLMGNKDGNKSKVSVMLTPPSSAESESAKVEWSVMHPQYKNRSLRMSMSEGAATEDVTGGGDLAAPGKATGSGLQIVRVTSTRPDGTKPPAFRYVLYNPKTHEMLIKGPALEAYAKDKGLDKTNFYNSDGMTKLIVGKLQSKEAGTPSSLAEVDIEYESTKSGTTFLTTDFMVEASRYEAKPDEVAPTVGAATTLKVKSADTTEAAVTETVTETKVEEEIDPHKTDFDDLRYRLANSETSKENLKKRMDWFKKKFPNIPISVIESGLVDSIAFGKLEKGSAVLLSPLAAKGTVYHEAWHVWNILVNTPAERVALYDEARARTGMEMTDKEAEEFLAEEFMDFMMLGKAFRFSKNEAVKKSVFAKMWSWIKGFLKDVFDIDIDKDNTGKIEAAFDLIKNGKFEAAMPKQLAEDVYKRVGNLSPEETMSYIEDLNYRFFQSIVVDMRNNGGLVLDLNANYSTIYNGILEKYKKEVAEGLNVKNLERLIANFPELIKKHEVYLKEYGIKTMMPKLDKEADAIEDTVAEEREETEVENENDTSTDEERAEGRDKVQWVNANEKSPKEDMPVELKIVMGSISNVQLEKDPVTQRNYLQMKRHGKFGTVSAMGYHRLADILHNHLSRLTTPEEIMAEMEILRNTEPAVGRLYNLIGLNKDPLERNELEQKIIGQFFTSFITDRPELMLMNIRHDGTITTTDALENTNKKNLKNKWIYNAKILAESNDSKFVKFKDGQFIIDKAKLLKALTASGLDPVKVLGQLGIEIDMGRQLSRQKTENAISDYMVRLRDDIKAFPADKVLTIDGVFDRNIIKNQLEADALANALRGSFTEDSELTVVNQSGKMQWAVTKVHHVSNMINRLASLARKMKRGGKVEYPVELEKIKPFDGKEGNIYTVNSKYRVFSENGGQIKMVNLMGLTRTGGTGSAISDTTYGNYKMLAFNAILKNIIPLKRAAERSVEYGVEAMRADYNIDMGFVMENMDGYLRDELNSSFALLADIAGLTPHNDFGATTANYKNNAKKLRTFSFIHSVKYGDKSMPSLEDFFKEYAKDMGPVQDETLVEAINGMSNEYLKRYGKKIEAAKEKFIRATMANNKESLKESGLIVLDKKTGMWYIPGISTETLTSSDYFEFQEGDELSRDGLLTDTGLNRVILVHFNNYFVGIQEQFKTILGDPAMYKSPADIVKRVTSSASTISIIPNDSRTRAALSSTHKNISGKPHKEFIDQIIVQKIKGNAQENLVRMDSKHYKNMDIIDGQQWGSLDFVRSLLLRQGLWSDPQEMTYQYEMQKFIYKVLKNPELHALWPELSEREFTDEDGAFYIHTKGKFGPTPMWNGRTIDPGYTVFSKKVGGVHMGQIPALKPLGAGFIADNANIAKMNITKMSVAPLFPSIVSPDKLSIVISMFRNEIDTFGDGNSQKAESSVNEIDFSKPVDFSTAKKTTLRYDDYGTQNYVQTEEKRTVSDSVQKTSVITNDILERGQLAAEFEGDEHLVELIKERDSLINDITKANMAMVIDKLGIVKVGKNYSLPNKKENIDKFRSLLSELFEMRVMPDNIVDTLDQILISDTKLLDLFTDKRKIESILLSYVKNKVVKRKVRGEMLVQEAGWMYDETLKFYEKGKNGEKTTRMEVMIPVPESWSKWVKRIGGVDTLNRMLENGELDERLHTFMANRVPTTDLNTIEAITVKKFLPTYVGTRIVLPTAIVGKTSSDFDIDKLTSYFNNFKIDKKTGEPSYIEYDKASLESMSPRQRRDAIENRLNEIYSELLLHPKRYNLLVEPHTSARLDAIAFEGYRPSTVLDNMEDDEGDEFYSVTHWWLNARKARSLWTAMKGLGITAATNASNSTHQRFPIRIEDPIMSLRTSSASGLLFFEGQRLEDSKERYSSGSLNDMGIEVIDSKGLKSRKTNRISDNFGQTIVSEVDVAKKDLAYKLNLTDKTVGDVAFLNMFGRKLTPSFNAIFALMSHPMISEFLLRDDASKSFYAKNNQYQIDSKSQLEEESVEWFEEYFGNESIIVDKILSSKYSKKDHGTSLPSTYHETLAASVKKYYNAVTKNDVAKAKAEIIEKVNRYKYRYLSTDELLSDSKRVAIQALDNFLMYKEFSRFATSLNTVVRPQSESSFGKTMSSLANRLARKRELLATGFFNVDDINKHLDESHLNETNKAYPEAMDMYKWGYLAFKHPMLAGHLQGMVNELTKYKTKEVAIDISSSIQNAFTSFVLSSAFGDIASIKGNYQALILGDNSVARRLNKAKNKIKTPLFQYLEGVVAEYSFDAQTTKENNYVKKNTKKIPASRSNMIYADFQDMMMSNDPEVSGLANDLFLLSMVQSGTSPSAITFMDVTPGPNFVATFDAYLANFEQELDAMDDITLNGLMARFKDQFYRNNWNDSDILYHVDKSLKLKKQSTPENPLGSLREVSFKADSITAKKPYITINLAMYTREQRYQMKKEGKRIIYPTLIYRNANKKDRWGNAVFELVSKLGDGIRFQEYYYMKSGKVASIIESNSYPEIVVTKQEPAKDGDTKKNTGVVEKRRYQLTANEQNAPNANLDGMMKDFIRVAGFTYKAAEVLMDKTGTKIPAVAMTDLMNKTIEVIEGKRDIMTLPEEAAHLYVQMLPKDNALYKTMMKDIVNHPIYHDVLEEYAKTNEYDDVDFKEEAIGKLIANRIVNSSADVRAEERQQRQENTWFAKIMDFLRNFFTNTKNDPYIKSAYDILNKNVAELNTKAEETIEEDVVEEKKEKSSIEEWNELPYTPRGIYKYIYKRTVSDAENTFAAMKETFGDDNVYMYETNVDGFRAKVVVRKPIDSSDNDMIAFKKEEIAMSNIQEMAKSPNVEFSADQLVLNFNEYFSDENWIEESEKVAIMKAIELGENEISCKF